MRVLLIGASGQLGQDLLTNNPGDEIVAPSRNELDLARPDQISLIAREVQPDFVINCAAFHNVPLCEQQAAEAFLINCIGLRDLSLACAEQGAWLITFSSDYVFNGDKDTPYVETDVPCPLQVYGITRLAGEYAAQASSPLRTVIVRTCGLYGRAFSRSKGGNFVDARVSDARQNKRIEISCEQVVTPTSTEDLSRAVHALIRHPELAPGIYHLVNDGYCSWYEFTRAIVDILDIRVEVAPVDRGGRDPRGFRRPLFSALKNARASAMGITLPPWKVALRKYLSRYL